MRDGIYSLAGLRICPPMAQYSCIGLGLMGSALVRAMDMGLGQEDAIAINKIML